MIRFSLMSVPWRSSLASMLALAMLPALCFGQFSQSRFQSVPPRSKLIKTGRILDVSSGTYVLRQAILTEGERIKEIGSWEQVSAHAPKDAIAIDLSQATVLPGLIDCHAHPLVSMDPHMDGGQAITTAVALMSPSLRVLIGARNLREDLESGITSVRVVGHSGIDGDIALRDGIRAGLVPGPRLQASGRKITPLGGQATYLQPSLAKPILEQEFLVASGPDDARRAVRENLAGGVDFIKIAVDNGAGPFWKFRYMAPADARAIVEDAHRLSLKVAAHAVDTTSIQTAIDAGVDSIEHAFLATDGQLQEMRDRGIFLVATDIPNNGGSPESRLRLQHALKIGVKIAMGSDLWSPIPDKTYGEASLLALGALHEEGMPNIDVIRSATIRGAELMGWSADVGQIAVGKFADIIAVSGDPLQTITILEHASFVMQGGNVIRNQAREN
jgi:imidazolonepropionase-like amidohydrolase